MDDILCLHGLLDRPLVQAFLQAVSRRVAGWTTGSLFVHVSGHGFFTGDTPICWRAVRLPKQRRW